MKQQSPSLAKITHPKLPEVLQRIRLFRWLDHARKHQVIWVAGLPGCGKTTLVSSYIESRKLPCLWYQVDEGDADVATFFHYLGLAAKKVAPYQRQPLPHLTPEYLSGLNTFTQRYFRDLYSRVTLPFVVVFDNYQQVAPDSRFHEVIRDGLGEVPEGVHVILISRSEPPPVLARWQANQTMATLGWEELLLTVEESQGIARLRGHEQLSRDELWQLHERAGGWAAGLVLMLERARIRGSATPAPREVSAEAIFDYFAGEIFKKTDREVQDLLLQSAFLPRMTPHMAGQLTGMPRAGRILSDLHRNHYFTERYVHSEPVYQHHPLFREFLLSCAKESFTSARLAQVQQTAAALLEADGQVEDAALLLREAGDWKGLVQLIGKQAPALLSQGRMQTLETWLGSIPQDILERTPWLLYWLGTCRLPFNLAEARRLCEKAFELFKAQQDPVGLFLAWSGVVDTFIYEWGDFAPVDPWIAMLDDLLDHYPFPSVEIETRVASSMFGILVYRQPQHPEISAWEERVQTLMLKSPDISQRMMLGNHLVAYYLWMGHYAKAALVIDVLRPVVRSPGVTPLTLTMWLSMEAAYHWFMASHEACLRAVTEGLETGRTTGVHLWDFLLLAHGTWGVLIPGDHAAAAEFLRKMAAVMNPTHRLDMAHYHHLVGLAATCRGDLPPAIEHLQTAVRLATEAGMPFSQAVSRLGLAQALFEQGDHHQAAAYLATARQLGRDTNSLLIEYQSLLLEALLALNGGNEPQGLEFLRQALALGRKQNYMNDPWWLPSVMTRLCLKALEAGMEVEYVQNLIRQRGLVPDSPPLEVDGWPWALKVFTLGQFAVLNEEKPIPFTRKAQHRPLELLKALIAFGGREVSQYKLMDALWPEAEGDAAQGDFDTTLHRLRRLIGSDKILVLRDGQLSLDPRYCWVDTRAFELLLEKVDAALKGGRTDAAEREIDGLVKKALALYQGSFLDGDTDKAWSISLRERLHGRFLRQLDRLGGYWEQAGQWNKAVDCYLWGLEVDNLVEDFYQRLMVCYRRLGRRAEALGVYRRCCQTFATILGVEPSAATETLYQELLKE